MTFGYSKEISIGLIDSNGKSQGANVECYLQVETGPSGSQSLKEIVYLFKSTVSKFDHKHLKDIPKVEPGLLGFAKALSKEMKPFLSKGTRIQICTKVGSESRVVEVL